MSPVIINDEYTNTQLQDAIHSKNNADSRIASLRSETNYNLMYRLKMEMEEAHSDAGNACQKLEGIRDELGARLAVWNDHRDDDVGFEGEMNAADYEAETLKMLEYIQDEAGQFTEYSCNVETCPGINAEDISELAESIFEHNKAQNIVVQTKNVIDNGIDMEKVQEMMSQVIKDIVTKTREVGFGVESLTYALTMKDKFEAEDRQIEAFAVQAFIDANSDDGDDEEDAA